ncbi:excinuclease ABC subunit B [Candidatus Synechococcus spongiarum LMB bulk10D]|nr:excinuclease ABC subunit B [Candidatus Synechococcus spongiarum LMB bulk10D]
MSFRLHSPFQPCGDQPQAIEKITLQFKEGTKEQTLMGVTGSGKTFTMAHVISQLNRPTLIIAPNKTLAAQLFTEFCEFFPEDAVDFFISYYDYYQPEAYIPSTGTYIAKDASINDDIDKMRHRCTQHLFEKPQVIIIASVSCIYGLGSPDAYSELALTLKKGQIISRRDFIQELLNIRYSRNDAHLKRGCFRLRGEICDLMPSHEKKHAIRIEFFCDEIEEIFLIDPVSTDIITTLDDITLYPNTHYIAAQKNIRDIIPQIQEDLRKQLQFFHSLSKNLEAKRLEERVMQDIESFECLGYCSGIENYSRYLSGTQPGEPPPTLLDYFPDDFLTIIDESHLTVPQLNAMYRGDLARKKNLVDFGFRLPAALDNRPLQFSEFKERIDKLLYVSATPGSYELDQCKDKMAQQIIRPTGLVDPKIILHPAKTQIDDLYHQLTKIVEQKNKAFVLTLTKKMSEDLCAYFQNMNFRVRYLHSKINTLERDILLKKLRQDDYDILIGINLLREGLDLPEVSLVAILDADKEGFLRSKNSLIQMVGRAARNVHGQVIFYADTITQSMQGAIDETNRRRKIQLEYNHRHNISPTTIHKKVAPNLRSLYGITDDSSDKDASLLELSKQYSGANVQEITKIISQKKAEMKKAAGDLNFEKAHHLQKEIRQLSASLSS